jgi:hypothetical protein
MTVEPARADGICPGCKEALDPCGHHLQVCRKRASFMWCHQIWQRFFTNATPMTSTRSTRPTAPR